MTAPHDPLDVAETRAADDTVAVDHPRLVRDALAERTALVYLVAHTSAQG